MAASRVAEGTVCAGGGTSPLGMLELVARRETRSREAGETRSAARIWCRLERHCGPAIGCVWAVAMTGTFMGLCLWG